MDQLKSIQFLNEEIPESIENGYFLFYMMPSLRCSLNCPHCFIAKENRKSHENISIENLQIICNKIDTYYQNRRLDKKTILFEWLGGEPTEMGLGYFSSAINILNQTFTKEKGYFIKNTIITALVNLKLSEWIEFFKTAFDKKIATSYDGLMRGKGYIKKWEQHVGILINEGFYVKTLSTINSELIKQGPIKTMDYLIDLKVNECSFLPFMLTTANDMTTYQKYSPTMNEWGDFMMGVTEYYFSKKAKGEWVPEIGQMNHILTYYNGKGIRTAFSHALQLFPGGNITLGETVGGVVNPACVLGNLLKQDFESILKSKERKRLIRNHLFKGGVQECQECEHSDKCIMEVMEFWQQRRHNDDCFGGKKYINWLIEFIKKNDIDPISKTHTDKVC